MTFRFTSALGLEESNQELENPGVDSLVLGCIASPCGRKGTWKTQAAAWVTGAKGHPSKSSREGAGEADS